MRAKPPHPQRVFMQQRRGTCDGTRRGSYPVLDNAGRLTLEWLVRDRPLAHHLPDRHRAPPSTGAAMQPQGDIPPRARVVEGL